jgi:hypothetical protein
MHVFKHPNFYKEYRRRAKREQALERASEREQANKQERERASKRKVTSGSRASKK